MPFWLLPIVVVGGLVGFAALLLGVLFVLSRFRNGRYLRPLIQTLAKVPFMRRWFQRVSTAAIERQNPELASAMKKLQRLGPNVDPVKAQQALSRLSASERRAYLQAAEEQGQMQEPANRQIRRLQQRMQAGGGPPARPAGGGQRKRKRR